MPPLRSASSAIGKRRQPSASDEPSILSSWRVRSSTMKRRCRICRTVTATPPTNVLCSGIRTLYWRESYWRKVLPAYQPGHCRHTLTHAPSGIDVQAELRAKTGSPNLGPTRPAASAHASPNQPPLQQRAILNRQQQRRSLQGPPKADGTNGLPMIQPDGPIQRSPLSQPTPGSHLSSPAQSATRSPNFIPQGHSVSPNFGPIPPQQQQQQLRPQPPRSQFNPNPMMPSPQRPISNQGPVNGIPGASSIGPNANGITQSSGPSPFYQAQYSDHMNQLGKLTPIFPYPHLGIGLCNPRLIGV